MKSTFVKGPLIAGDVTIDNAAVKSAPYLATDSAGKIFKTTAPGGAVGSVVYRGALVMNLVNEFDGLSIYPEKVKIPFAVAENDAIFVTSKGADVDTVGFHFICLAALVAFDPPNDKNVRIVLQNITDYPFGVGYTLNVMITVIR